MADQTDPYICRECGHVGTPNFNHWDMVEYTRDGERRESFGSTPRCTECGKIVHRKREWIGLDYHEKNDPKSAVGMVLIPFFIMIPAALIFPHYAAIFGLLGVISFIGTVISFEVGKRRYIRMCEEE